MVLRLNPELIDSLGLERQMAPLPAAQRAAVLGRGLLLCTGEVEEKPALVEETFHYFVQAIWDAVGLSKSDPRNRRFLLGLRGDADKQRLLTWLDAVPQGDASRVGADKVGIDAGSPVKRLNEIYSYYLPTNPGIYTLPPDKRLVPSADGSEYQLRANVSGESPRR
jgi:hypothetical protein